MSRGAKRKPAAMKVDLSEEQKAARCQKGALLKKTMKIKKEVHKVKDQIKKLSPDVIHQVILYKIIFNIIYFICQGNSIHNHL